MAFRGAKKRQRRLKCDAWDEEQPKRQLERQSASKSQRALWLVGRI